MHWLSYDKISTGRLIESLSFSEAIELADGSGSIGFNGPEDLNLSYHRNSGVSGIERNRVNSVMGNKRDRR